MFSSPASAAQSRTSKGSLKIRIILAQQKYENVWNLFYCNCIDQNEQLKCAEDVNLFINDIISSLC